MDYLQVFVFITVHWWILPRITNLGNKHTQKQRSPSCVKIDLNTNTKRTTISTKILGGLVGHDRRCCLLTGAAPFGRVCNCNLAPLHASLPMSFFPCFLPPSHAHWAHHRHHLRLLLHHLPFLPSNTILDLISASWNPTKFQTLPKKKDSFFLIPLKLFSSLYQNAS